MDVKKIGVGVVGCGQISRIYLETMKKFPFLAVAACADLDGRKAASRAEEFGVAKVCTPEEIMDDPAIDVVVNLTVPAAHAPVNAAAIAAGKHVYCEKPFATMREDGRGVLDAATRNRLLTGCAPDTILGAGIQTCRKIIDDGLIGRPVAAVAFMMGHGPESWHANPFFFYEPGAGPLFDMGPYYVSALVSLLGPVAEVTAIAGKSFDYRIATSQEHNGKKIPVKTPTHVAGTLRFVTGAIGTIITSFDIWGHHCPRIEIYGAEGSLVVPDPNAFSGQVLLRQAGSREWQEMPLTHGYAENSRGLGIADMARAIVTGRKHRCDGRFAFHVLDVMQGLLEASERKAHLNIESACDRPDPMPAGLAAGQID